ncbi:MAG: glycosyltransferase family 2 protein [Geminicoccaceae bacterium]
MPPPLVSIVIPVYNRAGLISNTIRSCLKQTYTRLEVVLVDDSSSDDLTSALLPFADEPNVRLVQHERNQGVSAARNSGVLAARGELVAFLDSDDAWLPDKLEKQVAHVASRPDDDFICGTLTEVRSEGAASRFRPKRRKPKDVPLGDYLFVDKVQRHLPLVNWSSTSLMGGCFAQTSSYLLPKTLAAATPFRTALNQYEDMAFLVDLDRKGVDFLLVEEPLTLQNDDERPGRLGAADDIARGQLFLDELGDALSPDARLAFEATHFAHLYGKERPARVIGLVLKAYCRGAITSKSVLGIFSRTILGQAGQKAMRDRLAAWRWRSGDRKAA